MPFKVPIEIRVFHHLLLGGVECLVTAEEVPLTHQFQHLVE